MKKIIFNYRLLLFCVYALFIFNIFMPRSLNYEKRNNIIKYKFYGIPVKTKQERD